MSSAPCPTLHYWLPTTWLSRLHSIHPPVRHSQPTILMLSLHCSHIMSSTAHTQTSVQCPSLSTRLSCLVCTPTSRVVKLSRLLPAPTCPTQQRPSTSPEVLSMWLTTSWSCQKTSPTLLSNSTYVLAAPVGGDEERKKKLKKVIKEGGKRGVEIE